MTHLEAVRPGATLVRQVMPRVRSASLQGPCASGEQLGEVPPSRRFGIGRAPLLGAIAHAAAGVRQSPNEHRAILSAMVDRDVDRAEPPFRQPIARSAARLAAAGSLG